MTNNGISFTGVLTIVFVTLKLVGVVAWSWWWVLAPVWGPAVIFACMALVLIALGAIIG